MKPIRLKFSGLQSYREEQDIDFEELGARGIFGVFGPTGGGKSTVLDAITLALFGKVERAKSGTRGIMNQFEKKLVVSFEFGLGSGRYLVERLYERDKNDAESVRNKNSRLMDVSAGNQVLADKATEVDSKVSELLGMSFEDFSRAVVLPQGKFDQFLKLTGGERAKMLEHIFFLERYGEALTKRVTENEKNIERRMEMTERLIEQLGDASKEKIDVVTKQLEQQKHVVREKDSIRKKAENTLKELEKLQGIHDQINSLEREQETLTAERSIVEREKLLVDKAVKAEALRGLLNQVAELEKTTAQELTALKTRESLAAAIKVRSESARIRLEKAVGSEEELTRLREELPKVAVALDLHRRVVEAEAEMAKLAVEKETGAKTLRDLLEEGTAKNELLKKITAKIEQLKVEQESLAGIQSCRLDLEKTAAALMSLDHAVEQEKEAVAALEKKKQQLLSEEETLRRLFRKYLSCGDVDIEKGELDKCLEQVDKTVNNAAAEKLDADQQLEHIRISNMTGVLAGKLAGGAPCPVCGSTDHPQPAQMGPSDEKLVENAKFRAGEMAERLEELRRWESEVRVLSKAVENLSADIQNSYRVRCEEKISNTKDAEKKVITIATALSEKVKDLPGINFVSIIEGKPVDLILLREKITGLKNTYEAAINRFDKTTREIADLNHKEKQLSEEVNSLRSSYREANVQVQNSNTNLEGLQTNISETRKSIDTITGGSPPREYENTIHNKINKLQAELIESRQEWETVQQEEQAGIREVTACKAAWEKSAQHQSMVIKQLENAMSDEGFVNISELKASLLDKAQREAIQNHIEVFEKKISHISKQLIELQEKAKESPFSSDELTKAKGAMEAAVKEHEEAVRTEGAFQSELEAIRQKHAEWVKLREESESLARKKDVAVRLTGLLKGRKFVQFLAGEHLTDMTAEASLRLSSLTGQRYALELDDSGNFVMRDDYSGGLRRPVSSLSGGETFLTSLSMALALSSKIQLKGRYPLGFFFLDEGFGTLDPEKLEVVMSTLERLHDGHRTVGVITHVPELRARMPRYLEVIPAGQDGTGSKAVLKKN